MKATEHYFPVVLFIMMYKVVQTLKSVDKTLWCDHSIETSLAELLQFIFLLSHKTKFDFLGEYFTLTTSRSERVKAF